MKIASVIPASTAATVRVANSGVLMRSRRRQAKPSYRPNLSARVVVYSISGGKDPTQVSEGIPPQLKHCIPCFDFIQLLLKKDLLNGKCDCSVVESCTAAKNDNASFHQHLQSEVIDLVLSMLGLTASFHELWIHHVA